jgi:hypothetical protein
MYISAWRKVRSRGVQECVSPKALTVRKWTGIKPEFDRVEIRFMCREENFEISLSKDEAVDFGLSVLGESGWTLTPVREPA